MIDHPDGQGRLIGIFPISVQFTQGLHPLEWLFMSAKHNLALTNNYEVHKIQQSQGNNSSIHITAVIPGLGF